MKRKRNYKVIFNGLVGRQCRPCKPRVVRTIVKSLVQCENGPFKGHKLCLVMHSDLTTLPFVVRGQSGRYQAGCWEAA